jgi:hypothetical protein
MSSTLSTHSVKILSTLIIVIDIMMLLAAIIFISNTKDANTQLTNRYNIWYFIYSDIGNTFYSYTAG